jgi:hypothetical protein
MSIFAGFIKSGIKDAESLFQPEITKISASEATLAPIAAKVNWAGLEAEANTFLAPVLQKYAPGLTPAELQAAETEVGSILSTVIAIFKKAHAQTK